MAVGGRHVDVMWPGNPTGQTRAERQPARFKAYVPNHLAEYEPSLTGALSALQSDADAAVKDLNRLDSAARFQIEALARQLLRQESLASSRIEGLVISHKRLSEAAYDPRGSSDYRALEVLANIEAMEESIRVGEGTDPISLETLLRLHADLMAPTRPEIAGQVRDGQNWVGGSVHTPIGAEFVPPPATEVAPLLEDLAEFMNRGDLPATLQAALVHAQFETIHPFADGNGRVGRCLVHVVYRRRGLAPHHVPPVSLLMASDVDRYVKALTAFREEREEDWIAYFSQVVIEAAHAAERFADRLGELRSAWKQQARARTGSTAEKVIEALPRQPVIDVSKAAELAGTSDEAARRALNSLADKGVIEQVTKRNWGRVWEARGLWNLLDRFEEELATPGGQERPIRPAPRTR